MVHRTRLIHPDDRAAVDGIPVTSVARTLVDLADVLDERRLAAAVNEAEVHAPLRPDRAIERTQAAPDGPPGPAPAAHAPSPPTPRRPGYSTSEAERLFLGSLSTA